MKKYLIFAAIASILISCNPKSNISFSNSTDVNQIDTVECEPGSKKDSIDIIIENRANTPLFSSIFAGLIFGDNRQTVEWTMNEEACKSFRVPDGEKVRTVEIKTYDADYYDDNLVSLTLYIEEDEYFSAIKTLYTTKYGLTKNSRWEYSDCTISIDYVLRELYDPTYEAGYGHSWTGTKMYFENVRCTHGNQASPGTPLTQDPYFIKICYENHKLKYLLKHRVHVKDTINKYDLWDKDKEKEIAHILATEPATNI